MDTIDLLQSHRSIRKFTDQKIDAELLASILKAGQSAASSSFMQAYSVIRVTDTEKREKLAELAGNQPYIKSCAEFLVCCGDLARDSVVCADPNLDCEPSHIEQLLVAAVDTALMSQNMVVAAESKGLGICYIGGIRNNPQEVSDLLGLPDFVFPVFGLCLGYPAQNPEPKPRLPLQHWVMENHYDTESSADLSDYDKRVSEYYAMRTSNKKTSTWSQELKALFFTKVRPQLLSFLQKRGLAKR